MFTKSADAHEAGWFSRRHKTSAAHTNAVEEYKNGSARHRAKAVRRRKQHESK